MEQQLIQGAGAALLRQFGPQTVIYTESVRQQLKRPCFFVECGEISQQRVIGSRYLRRIPLTITWFPPDEGIPSEKNRFMAQTAEGLLAAMEQLTLPDGSLLRGTGLRVQKLGDTLRFSGQYGGFVRLLPDENPTLMGTLTLREGVDLPQQEERTSL